MALVRNTYFELYTGFDENSNESFEALKYLKQLKESTGFFFRHLHYNDQNQYKIIFDNIKEWYGSDVKFPFVTYREIYDENDNFNEVLKCVVGLDNIKKVDWKELEDFKG